VTSKPDFKVMVLLLVFMQLTRDLFAIAKFLFISWDSLPVFGLGYGKHFKFRTEIGNTIYTVSNKNTPKLFW